MLVTPLNRFDRHSPSRDGVHSVTASEVQAQTPDWALIDVSNCHPVGVRSRSRRSSTVEQEHDGNTLPLMTTQGQLLQLHCHGLSHDGRGVARLPDQSVVFVPDLLPGEVAGVRLLRQHRKSWEGIVQNRALISPERRQPPCILADRCGGCSLQHLSDSGQAQAKQDTVQAALRRIGHLELNDAVLQPFLSCPLTLGYRNRAIIPLERREDGHLRAGYYRNGTHTLVNMNECPVLDPRLDRLLRPLKNDLESSSWPVDRHLQTHGGLRHLALRIAPSSGEILITLISSHSNLEGLEGMANRWMHRWPDVVGVCLNLQPKNTNTLFGPDTSVVAGRGSVTEHFAGLDLQIAADTFFQVNTSQAERVVSLIAAALGACSGGLLIDGYCGIGTYGLPMAAAGWRIHGIENHPASIALARHNAAANHLDERCTFDVVDMAEGLSRCLDQATAVLLDPPRRGLDPGVVSALIQSPTPTLLMLSCDPATLARDLRLLNETYLITSVQAIDFFPNTSHVETLAVLKARDLTRATGH